MSVLQADSYALMIMLSRSFYFTPVIGHLIIPLSAARLSQRNLPHICATSRTNGPLLQMRDGSKNLSL